VQVLNEIDNKNEDNKELVDKINQFPPKLKKILQLRTKNIAGLSLKELAELTNNDYGSIRTLIYNSNKKGLQFHKVMDEISQELVTGRKLEVDNKFYKLICESNDLEEIRKSAKTFYELNKLIQPENKPVIQTNIAINIPISLKDTKPLDIDN